MTVSPAIPPSTATQSPTAGKRGRIVVGIEAEATADRGPLLAGGAGELVRAAILGDDPGRLAARAPRCARWASARAGVQPRAVEASGRRSIGRLIRLASACRSAWRSARRGRTPTARTG